MLYTHWCLVVNKPRCGFVCVLATNAYDVLSLRICVSGQVMRTFGRYLVILDHFQGALTVL